MFRLSTKEGGLEAEQSLAKRLDKSLTKQERAWLRAQALEAAKLRAAEEAAPLAFARHSHAVAPTAVAVTSPRETATRTGPAIQALAIAPTRTADETQPVQSNAAFHGVSRPVVPRVQSRTVAPMADLGREHLPALEVGGADTASDIALYGHDVKLRHLRQRDAAAGAAGGGDAGAGHTQATDEILVRLLSLAHAGLLHPHMSLGLSRHPAHRRAAGDLHAAAVRDDVAAARPGGRSDGSFAALIRGQLGGVLHGPRAAAAAARLLPSSAPPASPVDSAGASASPAAVVKVAAGGRRQARGASAAPRAGLAAGASPYSAQTQAQAQARARAQAQMRAPATMWSVLTSPLQFLFGDAKVAKVVVPT